MNEDVKSENLRIHSRADELIACLEGEIAKRDEELAACRVSVENCEVFRARIAELEAKTRTAMGVGSGSGNLFVYGNYDSIKAAQKIVIERDQHAQRIGELAELASQANVNCKNTAYYLRKYRPDLADICSGWCVAIDAALSAGKDSVS